MINFNTIEEFNNYLLTNKMNIDKDMYYTYALTKLYPEVDTEFVNYYRSLDNFDEPFTVDQSKLIKYKLVESEDKILEFLINEEFEENNDYIVEYINNKPNYKLSEYAFKMTVIRFNNLSCKDYGVNLQINYGYCKYIETNNARSLAEDKEHTKILKQLNESLKENLLLKKQIIESNKQFEILTQNYKKTNEEVNDLVSYANMLKSIIESR